MDYNTLDKELIREIPELKLFYDEELELWDGEEPGQHIIFGNVLNPYLINLIETNKNQELIKRIFDFLEKMACSDNELVQEVLGCTVLERLGDDNMVLTKSKEYMGKETKIISSKIQKGLGR